MCIILDILDLDLQSSSHESSCCKLIQSTRFLVWHLMVNFYDELSQYCTHQCQGLSNDKLEYTLQLQSFQGPTKILVHGQMWDCIFVAVMCFDCSCNRNGQDSWLFAFYQGLKIRIQTINFIQTFPFILINIIEQTLQNRVFNISKSKMVKSIADKSKSRNNFHKRMDILKEDYKLKQNLYSDTLCRLIKDVSRQLVRNQTEEALFQAKRKIIELSLVSTEELFKNMAEACSKTAEFNKIISQINKTSERKARKKCEVIAVVNYVRRMIKGIETSGTMDNLNFQKEQAQIIEPFRPIRDTNYF